MGYSSLYVLSLGTMGGCRAGNDKPRFGREGRKYNPWFPWKNPIGGFSHRSWLSIQACRQSPPPDCSLHWAHAEHYLMYTKWKPFSEFWTGSVQLSIFLLQTKEFFPEVCWICFIVKCFSFKMSLCVDNLVWRLLHCTLFDQVLSTIQWMSWPSNPI